MASNVLALNEANITVNNFDTGVCFAVNNITDIKCNGETMLIDGTRDNFLYITYVSDLKPEFNITKTVETIIFTPLGILPLLLTFALMFGFSITILILVVWFLGILIGGKSKNPL